jgi:hypothetical protein
MAHLHLAPATKPIPIPGGVRVPEPILNGTVSGPAINGTIYPLTSFAFGYQWDCACSHH